MNIHVPNLQADLAGYDFDLHPGSVYFCHLNGDLHRQHQIVNLPTAANKSTGKGEIIQI